MAAKTGSVTSLTLTEVRTPSPEEVRTPPRRSMCASYPPSVSRTPEKVRQTFRRLFPDIPPTNRDRIYVNLRREQKKMVPGMAFSIPPSDSFPELIFTCEEVHRVKEQVGMGGYSVVHKTEAMTFAPKPDFSLGEPKTMVVKRPREGSNPPYAQEAKRLALTLTPKSKGRRTIDHYRGVYRTMDGRFLSVHDCYDRTLDKVDYKGRDKPVSYIVPRLIQLMDGLCAIHRGGKVHRDIKGGNSLVMDDETLEDVAALTDFGFLGEVREGSHSTTGTVRYLAPFIFAQFYDQISRIGRQTQEADVFAFGRMLQQDVLACMLKQLGDEKGLLVDNLLEKIKPERKKATREVLEYGKAHPDRVFYQQPYSNREAFVYIFPTPEEGCAKMEALIELFKGKLPETEIAGMKQIAILAKRMQSVDPDQVPLASQVLEELKLINRSLKINLLEAIDSKVESPLGDFPAKSLPKREALEEDSAAGSHRDSTS